MFGPQRLGRCLNVGRCGLAGQREPIRLADGVKFACPECKSELVPFAGRPKEAKPGEAVRRVPKSLLWLALAVVVMVIIGIRYDLFGLELDQPPAISADSATTLVPAPPSVRVGAGIATYDELAPMLWRSFLIDQGCPEVDRTRNAANTVVSCLTGSNPKVTISAPQSAIGIAGLAMKTFDVVLTADPLFPAAPHGAVPTRPDADGPDADGNVIHADVIGVDALVVIVHPSNPLGRLSQPQLASIFAGATTDFALVGGPPGPITVIAPAAGARADDRLAAIIPKWLPLAATARRLVDSAAIVAAVRDDPRAIGLVERRAATAIKTLAIGPVDGIAVAPTALALISGDYPLARPVRAIRFNREASPYETAFVAFSRTAAAGAVITAAGFEPVRPDLFAPPAPATAPPAYRALVEGRQRFAANLRFRAASLDLEPQSLAALDDVAARLAGERIAADRINIVGLSDPVRADADADAASLARRIGTMLSERGIDSNSSIGVGGALAVAEPADGNRNRRVEIWISPAARAEPPSEP